VKHNQYKPIKPMVDQRQGFWRRLHRLPTVLIVRRPTILKSSSFRTKWNHRPDRQRFFREDQFSPLALSLISTLDPKPATRRISSGPSWTHPFKRDLLLYMHASPRAEHVLVQIICLFVFYFISFSLNATCFSMLAASPHTEHVLVQILFVVSFLILFSSFRGPVSLCALPHLVHSTSWCLFIFFLFLFQFILFSFKEDLFLHPCCLTSCRARPGAHSFFAFHFPSQPFPLKWTCFSMRAASPRAEHVLVHIPFFFSFFAPFFSFKEDLFLHARCLTWCRARPGADSLGTAGTASTAARKDPPYPALHKDRLLGRCKSLLVYSSETNSG
jgi:hypothetical protein